MNLPLALLNLPRGGRGREVEELTPWAVVKLDKGSLVPAFAPHLSAQVYPQQFDVLSHSMLMRLYVPDCSGLSSQLQLQVVVWSIQVSAMFSIILFVVVTPLLYTASVRVHIHTYYKPACPFHCRPHLYIEHNTNWEHPEGHSAELS